jgi:hypothetical protein
LREIILRLSDKGNTIYADRVCERAKPAMTAPPLPLDTRSAEATVSFIVLSSVVAKRCRIVTLPLAHGDLAQ